MTDDKTDLFYEPDEATRTSWEAWLAEWPEIEKWARQLPPWNCYRQTSKPTGHYAIHSYNPDGTVTLSHGRDSFLPGIQVFGVPANDLEPCGCRRWKWPTEQQARRTIRHIELTRDIRNANAKRRKPN